MKKFLGHVLVVDGSYMLMRAMKQPELSALSTKSGKSSGGIFGFLKMLSSAIHKYPGYYPIVCWDKGRSPRRLELYPNYKHNADHILNPVLPGTPDDDFLSNLRIQRGSVMEYLTSLRIPCIRIPEWEGDDLVYLISKASKKCIIVSDDKDMIQMCNPDCKVYRPMARELIEYETCDKWYKYPLYEYYKAIKGDPSDNLPQCVDGIGGTSAWKIAEVMADFVEESQCNPHDYSLIFNYLKSPELLERWKEVRGLRNKIQNFIESQDKFELNMKLMDFSFIEEPIDMQTIIESQVSPTINRKPSIMEAFRILGQYEIRDLDPGQLMARLVGSNGVLLKED